MLFMKKNVRLSTWMGLLCSLVLFGPRHVVAQIIQIGHGTEYDNMYNIISDLKENNTWSPAARLTGKNAKYQQLFTAQELRDLGVNGPALLDSIAWQVQKANGTILPNYTVKIKNTATSLMSELESGNFQTVYTANLVISDTGWNWLKFQTPFFWNGLDNIVIDVCRDSTAVNRGWGETQLCYFEYSWTNVELMGKSRALTFGRFDTICNARGEGDGGDDKRYNIRMSFSQPPACTGTPVAGPIQPSASFTNLCPGTPISISSLSPQEVSGLNYQWEQRAPGGAWTAISGATMPSLQPAPVEDAEYRLHLTCINSSQSVYSGSATATVNSNPTPLFRSLPYAQDFESWQNYCSTSQLPDSNWTSYPSTGKMSWRREDQGASGGWTEDVTPSYYFPHSTTGNHSARVQTSKGPAGNMGNISVYLDCGASDSAKEMRFDYFNRTTSMNKLTVMLSTDGGSHFTELEVLGSMGVSSIWRSYVIPFSSKSEKTVIRFQAFSSDYQSGDFDLGIDNLRVYPSCSGKPTVGTINPASACVGEGVELSVSGNSQNGGLEWQWQESQGINWTNVPGGNVESPTVALNNDTWYRAIVTCVNGGLSDTSAPVLVKVKSTAECYCASGPTLSQATSPINIGNVSLLSSAGDTLMTNGTVASFTSNPLANQKYSDFTSLGPVNLYLDSSYRIYLAFMTVNGSNVNPRMSESYTKIFIDYNQDGIFDYPSEQVFGKLKPQSNNANGVGPGFRDTADFTIPNTALPGVTRMRILTNYDTWDTTLIEPCGAYWGGETEDYLVQFISLPCTGTESAGTIASMDSLYCPDYPVHLENLNPDNTTGPIGRIWQSSPDGIAWTDIAGSDNAAAITEMFNGAIYYRVKATCALNQVEAYSDTLRLDQYTLCYCASYADGGFAGAADSSDVGGFSLGDINIPLTGGHLNNPDAVKAHTNHSMSGVTELYEDSTYGFTLSHIILRGAHGDARATIYIDYNANGEYEANEMAYTGISGATTWRMTGSVNIPRGVTLNTPTGFRVIISNDAVAGVPDPCGSFVSGETEDFIVRFVENPVGVAELSSFAANVRIYPNPTSGMISVQYQGAPVDKATVRILNITGQEVMGYTFDRLSDGDVVHMDLKGHAAGLYMIRIEADGLKATGRVVLQ